MTAVQIHLVDNLYVTREPEDGFMNLHFMLHDRKIKFFIGEATHRFRVNVDNFMIGDVTSIEVGENSAWISKAADGAYNFKMCTRDGDIVTFELTRDEAFAIVEEIRNSSIVPDD